MRLCKTKVLDRTDLLMKMLSSQYGDPATHKLQEKVMVEHQKKIQEIPRSRFLICVNPILKKQFNCNFDMLLEEFLKSQNGMNIEKIEFDIDSEQFSVFLRVIGDPPSVMILTAIDEDTTVQEISNQTRLSVPTVYRKVERLYDVGLVIRKTPKYNSKQILYSKTIHKINLDISKNKSKIVIIPKKGAMHLQRILYLI